MDHWSKDRVILLGDAANALHFFISEDFERDR